MENGFSKGWVIMIKKLLISCLFFSFIFLINIGYGYSLQIIVDGQSITIDKSENEAVTLNILRSDCLGWKVKQGNVEIVENFFVMPSENVVIEAIIPTEYLLSTGLHDMIIESDQPVGTKVTISAASTLNGAFSWLSWGMILSNTNDQKLTFTMPYNEVKLNAN